MQAASQLERRASVTARMRHQVAIGGQQLYGVGSYWQQGSGEELKVRLELQIAGQDAKLLQVCNSRFLWIDRQLPTGRTVTRIDLRQLRADPSLGAPNLDDIKPGEANWSSLQSGAHRIHRRPAEACSPRSARTFTFLPPQAMRLAIAPPLSSEPTNVPVFAVVGQWKPEKLAALLSKTQADASRRPTTAAAQAEARRKPRPSPSGCRKKCCCWSARPTCSRTASNTAGWKRPSCTGGDGPPIPYQLSAHPMVVLELTDVTFDAPIAAGQFDYTPGDADWVDQTTAILERLRQEHQAQVATRPGPPNK